MVRRAPQCYPVPVMERTLLAGFVTSHSFNLFMSLSLLYIDVMRFRSNRITCFETVLAVIFGCGQVAITLTAITYAVAALATESQVYWLEPLLFSSVQADVALNV